MHQTCNVLKNGSLLVPTALIWYAITVNGYTHNEARKSATHW